MDHTMKKMNFVQAKLGKLLKTNDMGQICTIIVLFLILIVMIFLVIYTWFININFENIIIVLIAFSLDHILPSLLILNASSQSSLIHHQFKNKFTPYFRVDALLSQKDHFLEPLLRLKKLLFIKPCSTNFGRQEIKWVHHLKIEVSKSVFFVWLQLSLFPKCSWLHSCMKSSLNRLNLENHFSFLSSLARCE